MLAADADIQEILRTLERVQSTLDDIVVRGLRSAAPEQLKSLDVMQEQFDRVGAAHLSLRLKTLATALRDDDPRAAAALLNAQASVRLYERLLTLENATAALQAWIDGASENDQDGEDDDAEDEDDEEDEEEDEEDDA